MIIDKKNNFLSKVFLFRIAYLFFWVFIHQETPGQEIISSYTKKEKVYTLGDYFDYFRKVLVEIDSSLEERSRGESKFNSGQLGPYEFDDEVSDEDILSDEDRIENSVDAIIDRVYQKWQMNIRIEDAKNIVDIDAKSLLKELTLSFAGLKKYKQEFILDSKKRKATQNIYNVVERFLIKSYKDKPENMNIEYTSFLKEMVEKLEAIKNEKSNGLVFVDLLLTTMTFFYHLEKSFKEISEDEKGPFSSFSKEDYRRFLQKSYIDEVHQEYGLFAYEDERGFIQGAQDGLSFMFETLKKIKEKKISEEKLFTIEFHNDLQKKLVSHIHRYKKLPEKKKVLLIGYRDYKKMNDCLSSSEDEEIINEKDGYRRAFAAISPDWSMQGEDFVKTYGDKTGFFKFQFYFQEDLDSDSSDEDNGIRYLSVKSGDRDEIRLRGQEILSKLQKEISRIKKRNNLKDKEVNESLIIRAIVSSIKLLELSHLFPDGNGRTSHTYLIGLLFMYTGKLMYLPDSNDLDYKGVDEVIENLRPFNVEGKISKKE